MAVTRTTAERAASLFAARGDWPLVLLLWAALALFGILAYRPENSALALVDADDWLRLVEVLDLLAGQACYDLFHSPHRCVCGALTEYTNG